MSISSISTASIRLCMVSGHPFIDFIAKLIVTCGANVKVETPVSLKSAVKKELDCIRSMY